MVRKYLLRRQRVSLLWSSGNAMPRSGVQRSLGERAEERLGSQKKASATNRMALRMALRG